MRVTKFVHSCVLVEMPNSTALFDPGMMSGEALDVDKLMFLDDIFITHEHGDHFSLELVRKLVAKFPNVRITTTSPVVAQLEAEGIKATVTPPDTAQIFTSSHEEVEPLFPRPLQIGVHYENAFSHPGDSYNFSTIMPVLALPVTAPWGSVVAATNLALKLKPQYILPVHDWHWSDEARLQTYDMLERLFGQESIIFLKPETGKPISIDL